MGERDELDEVFRTEGPRLWRAVYAYVGGRRELADEAVAEAFARALQHDADIRSPVPWLYRTAFRIAAAELRQRAKWDEMPETEHEDLIDTGDIVRALRELSPHQRAAVYLHYQADLPIREVASLLGSSTAAVKVHLHRGRKRLAVLLADQEEES